MILIRVKLKVSLTIKFDDIMGCAGIGKKIVIVSGANSDIASRAFAGIRARSRYSIYSDERKDDPEDHQI